MADLTTIPLEDGFQTTLSQKLTTTGLTMYVNGTPNLTFPAGETTYVVIEPKTDNIEIVEIESYDSSANTITISATGRGLNLGASYDPGAREHGVGSKVIISDNYAFWADIKTAINSKIGTDADATLDNSIKLQFGSSTAYIWTENSGTDLKFKDGSNAEITLSTIAAAAGADTKVGITVSDTTTATLDSKLTAGDGISKTVVSPGGAETLDLDIDTTDTAVFKLASSGAGDSGFAAILNASGQWADGFVNLGSATTANLTTLVDGSDAGTLHTHSLYPSFASTTWSNSGMYFRESTSNGTVTQTGGEYVRCNTAVASSAYALADVQVQGTCGVSDNPKFIVESQFVNNSAQIIYNIGFGAGNRSSSTYTGAHALFFVENSTLYASVADGATQQKSSAITGYTLTNYNEFRIESDGTNFLFYVNDTLEHTSSANEPTALGNVGMACHLVSGATISDLRNQWMAYQYDK